MRKHKKNLSKKVFTYFIGVYFVLSGILISRNDILAAGGIGTACTNNAECTYGLYCSTAPISNYPANTCIPQATAGATPVTTADMTEVLAPKKKMVETIKFTPQIGIPGSFEKGTAYDAGEQKINSTTGKTEMATNLFSKYLGAFYRYGLSIVGLIATVTLMGGGILWLTSMGNDSKITKAKEMIFGSLVGVALLYGSYLILNTVNPAMVQLKSINTPIIAPVELICCQFSNDAKMITDEKCVSEKGKRKYGYSKEGSLCVKNGCCVVTIKTTKNEYTQCLETSSGLCKMKFWNPTSFKFHDAQCSDPKSGVSAICANNMFNCEGIEDGEDCQYNVGTTKTNKITKELPGATCYGGTCYLSGDQMGLGMPCGNRPGSLCYRNNCSGKSSDGKELYTDKKDVDFKDNCAKGLSCCNTKTASE
jgi:hypothetical protein